jgi:hypothetical protein
MNHRTDMIKHLSVVVLALASSAAFAADPAPTTSAAARTNAPAAKSTPSSGRTAASAAKPAPPAITLSYDAFAAIGEKNIFNQNRSGPRTTPREIAKPAPVVDMIGFVGTMDYGKGQMAFFNGTSGDFKKMAKAGDSVGGFKLVSVTTSQVKLSASEKEELALTIGQALRRENSGPWEVSSQPLPDDTSSGGSSSGLDRVSRALDSFNGRGRGGFDTGGGRTRGGTTAFGGFGGMDATPTLQTTNSGLSEAEVMKRLIEKRAKE